MASGVSAHVRERVRALEVKFETLWEPLNEDMETLGKEFGELKEAVEFYAKMGTMLFMSVLLHGGSEYARAAGDFVGLLLGVHG